MSSISLLFPSKNICFVSKNTNVRSSCQIKGAVLAFTNVKSSENEMLDILNIKFDSKMTFSETRINLSAWYGLDSSSHKYDFENQDPVLQKTIKGERELLPNRFEVVHFQFWAADEYLPVSPVEASQKKGESLFTIGFPMVSGNTQHWAADVGVSYYSQLL